MSSNSVAGVLGVVGGLIGQALLGVLLNPPQGFLKAGEGSGVCAAATETCSHAQRAYLFGAELSFALIMLSVIMCIAVAIDFTKYLGLTILCFLFSLMALVAAMVAAAWVLLPAPSAGFASIVLVAMIVASLWALRPAFLLAYCAMKGLTGSPWGRNALHWAVASDWPRRMPFKWLLVKRAAMVQVLLASGLNVDAAAGDNNQGPTPLLMALTVRPIDIEVIYLLVVKGGADVNKAAGNGVTPLMPAVAAGSESVVRLLLASGADAKAVDSDQEGVCEYAVRGSGQSALLDLLREHGVELPSQTNLSIMSAVEHNDLPRLCHLVKNACFTANFVYRNDTPLRLAAQKGYIDIVQYLLQQGAHVDMRETTHGTTPLMAAAFNGHVDVVNILLVAGAAINAVATSANPKGVSPLWLAASQGHLAVVQALIAAGVDVNMADFAGDTPLSQAARNQHHEVAVALSDAGARIQTQGAAGATPMLIAIIQGDVEMVALFLRKDAAGFAPVRDDIRRAAEAYAEPNQARGQLILRMIMANLFPDGPP